MSPLLIDNRGLLKLGLISVLAAVLAFAAGFFTGFQRAGSFYQTGKEITSLPLPVKVSIAEVDIEPRIPEIISVGEDIDVDKPATVTDTVIYSATKVNAVKASDQASHNNSSEKVKLTTKRPKTESINPVDHSVLGAVDNAVLLNVDQSVLPATNQILSELERNFSSDELSKIKYSIQVGMYGQLTNAENMMTQLHANKFNAYVSDYINKKNETRYNVRVGYFFDKKSALSALEEYKNRQKGDGYLVKFSVDNIVNVAKIEDIKQPDANGNKDKNLSPVTSPIDDGQEKVSQAVSQADILNTPREKAEIVTN